MIDPTSIKIIKIETIQDFCQEIDGLDLDKWIFRGQADSNWALEPAIYRYCKRLSSLKNTIKPLLGREKIEWRKIMRELEFSLFNAYVQNQSQGRELKKENDILKVLMELQHYSCPTRLLDFTWSPYVAAYFAADEGEADFSIYAINSRTLEEIEKCSSALIEHFWGESGAEEPKVFLYRPNYTNERIKTQKGVFLIPSTTVLSFEEILSSAKICLTKFIFPSRLRPHLIILLNKMNLGPRSIYPEREGAIKELAWETMARVL